MLAYIAENLIYNVLSIGVGCSWPSSSCSHLQLDMNRFVITFTNTGLVSMFINEHSRVIFTCIHYALHSLGIIH